MPICMSPHRSHSVSGVAECLHIMLPMQLILGAIKNGARLVMLTAAGACQMSRVHPSSSINQTTTQGDLYC